LAHPFSTAQATENAATQPRLASAGVRGRIRGSWVAVAAVNRSTVWGPQAASSFSKAGRPSAQWAGGGSSGNSARREVAQRAGTVSSWLVVADVQRTSTSTATVSSVCC